MKVLVVDDDPLVRAMAVEALADEGFCITEAGTAEEALAHCAKADFDVLFTDIMLPGRLSGWDIAERCREAAPELPVIYATGYSHSEPRPVTGSILLHKPYPIDRLVSAIRQVTR